MGVIRPSIALSGRSFALQEKPPMEIRSAVGASSGLGFEAVLLYDCDNLGAGQRASLAVYFNIEALLDNRGFRKHFQTVFEFLKKKKWKISKAEKEFHRNTSNVRPYLLYHALTIIPIPFDKEFMAEWSRFTSMTEAGKILTKWKTDKSNPYP